MLRQRLINLSCIWPKLATNSGPTGTRVSAPPFNRLPAIGSMFTSLLPRQIPNRDRIGSNDGDGAHLRPSTVPAIILLSCTLNLTSLPGPTLCSITSFGGGVTRVKASPILWEGLPRVMIGVLVFRMFGTIRFIRGPRLVRVVIVGLVPTSGRAVGAVRATKEGNVSTFRVIV